MTNFKDLYDDLYNSGYHSEFGFTHSRKLISVIDKMVPKNSKILDVGCSTGTACSMLQTIGYNSSGVDISATAIRLAKVNGVEDCKVSPADKIDYPDNYFDAILCTDVLEHIIPGDVDRVLMEFDRVTKPRSLYFLRIALKKESNRKYKKIKSKHGIKNLHTLVRGKKYWSNIFKKHNLFALKTIKSAGHLEIVVKKKIK